MSVSAPFFAPSMQVGFVQRSALAGQKPLAQSTSLSQMSPSGQAGQLPPQSTSVSVPFFTPSVQLAVDAMPPVPECALLALLARLALPAPPAPPELPVS